jgi:hypothetical protein
MNKFEAKPRIHLDTEYFKKALERIVRDIESYTPEEMERSLLVLADVAKHEKTTDSMIVLKGRDEAGCYDYKIRGRIAPCGGCYSFDCNGECVENL